MSAPPQSTIYGPDPTRHPLTGVRLERGWSQGELAKRAGVTRETVCRLELGYAKPTCQTAAKIAFALDYEPHVLFPANRMAL